MQPGGLFIIVTKDTFQKKRKAASKRAAGASNVVCTGCALQSCGTAAHPGRNVQQLPHVVCGNSKTPSRNTTNTSISPVFKKAPQVIPATNSGAGGLVGNHRACASCMARLSRRRLLVTSKTFLYDLTSPLNRPGTIVPILQQIEYGLGGVPLPHGGRCARRGCRPARCVGLNRTPTTRHQSISLFWNGPRHAATAMLCTPAFVPMRHDTLTAATNR